jgi:hypothetical protein
MHGTTGTRWLRSLGIAVVLLTATACSSDPPPAGAVETSTPSVSSSTPSPSPTATPVEQQVEAAVRAYYAELTRAAQTNDTSTLRTMVMKSCPCHNAVRIIERNTSIGRTTPDATFSLHSVKVHDITGKAASAEVRYDVSGYDVLGPGGAVKAHVAAQSSHLDLSLLEVGQAWMVANVFDLEG